MAQSVEAVPSWNEARRRILAQAEPVEPIEVSLGEALGLVLAEPVVADVDHPPLDRVGRDGYAVRADEAPPGALLRVVRAGGSGDLAIEAGEAGRVRAGDPLPLGADTVLRPRDVRADGDPELGPTRVIEVVRAARPDGAITRRGAFLTAGSVVAPAGARVTPGLVPLLAGQGCVHPFCHRRVRISIVAVGGRWVGPTDAPTMNRERNAGNLAVASLALAIDAMPQDFQAVSGSRVRTALERATTAPVVVVLGRLTRSLAEHWAELDYEPIVEGLRVAGVGLLRAGVIRDDEGRAVNHIIHLPSSPAAAMAGFALVVAPLVARLQGHVDDPEPSRLPLADGALLGATGPRPRVVPASTRTTPDGRVVAEPIDRPLDDLVAWSRADGILVLPADAGPRRGGDLVEFLSHRPGR